MSEWDNLDEAAEANLNQEQLQRFFKYKEEIRSEGHFWRDDADILLRGFIWDESEE